MLDTQNTKMKSNGPYSQVTHYPVKWEWQINNYKTKQERIINIEFDEQIPKTKTYQKLFLVIVLVALTFSQNKIQMNGGMRNILIIKRASMKHLKNIKPLPLGQS